MFLIRAAGRDAEEILAELDRRLGNDDATERAETVDNLRQIALLRLEALALMATLSTHVLDTAAGQPAAGVAVRLESRDGDVLDQGVTDDDGRVGSLGGELGLGGYVLRFDTGAYVRAASSPRSSSCSPSPTTATTTCPCCSRRTATRPTVAADLRGDPRPASGRRGRGGGGVRRGDGRADRRGDAVRPRAVGPPRW